MLTLVETMPVFGFCFKLLLDVFAPKCFHVLIFLLVQLVGSFLMWLLCIISTAAVPTAAKCQLKLRQRETYFISKGASSVSALNERFVERGRFQMCSLMTDCPSVAEPIS